jgi:hypothetical protein
MKMNMIKYPLIFLLLLYTSVLFSQDESEAKLLRQFHAMSIGTTDAVKKVFYHLPGDDPDAITIDIMEDVSKMIYVALINMANDASLTF